MSVYNDAQFIAESMESILSQDGPECEFVIVDDAGTDNSSAILDSHSDPRITLIRHDGNRGLAASLNHGLRYCRGKYIARQDGDDVSGPGRIRKQVALLEHHPEIAYLGTGLIVINEQGKQGRKYLFPEEPEEIRKQVRNLMTPLAHPTLMFRREALLAVNGYDELFKKSEDYDLHMRLLARFNASNIREPLVRLRLRGQSMQNSDSSGECLKYALFAHAKQLAECKLGTLQGSAEQLLLVGISEWFQQGTLGRCWKAGIDRRMALEKFVQGQRWLGLIEFVQAVVEDPRWVTDFIVHGRRIILTPSMRKQMEAIIDRVLGKPDPFIAREFEIQPFPYL
jgi:glycosyltransferase involved in cell wall biosynthesis